MSFGNVHMLWFLLVIPPGLFAFYWWAWQKRQALMRQFIQARLLPALTIGLSPGKQKLRFACVLAAVVCLIVALARPQWGFTWEEVKQRGLDIVVAIDTSKSMLAQDITPNRLGRAKLAALDLMRLAKSDRLGLVAFAGGAFLQCPLTIDDSAFRQSIEALDVNTIPQGGTALAEAIETAQTAFKEGDNHKILVILTDGEDHDSGALEAAKKAADTDTQIFTIGIGTPEGELLQIKDAKGRTDYVRDEQGNVVKSHLNETLLRQIAGATAHGFYLPLRGAQTMENLYTQGLAPLPKSESGEKLMRRYHERYHWPLALAILFLIVEMIIPEKRRSTRSAANPQANRIPKPALAAALVMIALPFSACGSPSSALREYRAGKYEEALKQYEQALEKQKDDPRLHFNAGAAAYQTHKYDEALKQFNESLNSPDLKLQEQAYYNLGNTLFNLGQTNPDPSQRSKSWEESLQNFENTMKLNPQDADAKYNHDLVKKMLEELKKQQQQQKQQDKDKDKKDDQKQDKDQQTKDDKNKDQQNKDQQQKQDDQKKDDQSKADQNKSDQNKDQAKQDQKKDPDKKDEQAKNQPDDKKDQDQQKPQPSGKPDDKSDEQNGEPGRTYAAGEMTPQQAKQLLDAQKGEEMVMPIKPELKKRAQNGPVKDW